MTQLSQAIKQRNQAGFLSLIPCMIPGFPDAATSLAVNQFLDAADSVTAIEFTLPASESFSDSVNQTIVTANQHASRIIGGIDIKRWLKTQTCNFIMIYRSALQQSSFETLAEQLAETCQGIFLEWDERDLTPYKQACDRAGIELVVAVDPEMSSAEIAHLCQFITPNGVVYMLCSPQAGGERHPPERLEAFAQQIKSHLPDSVIIASMGIYTPADVREMAGLPSVDAVVMGTGFFEAAEQGLPAVEAYLRAIEPELARKRSVSNTDI